MNNNENSSLDIFSQPIGNGRPIQTNNNENINLVNNEQLNNKFEKNTNLPNNNESKQESTFFENKIITENKQTEDNSKKFNPFGDSSTIQAQPVISKIVDNTNNNQNDIPKTIDSVISNLNNDNKEAFVISDESLLRAFIGSNYETITNKSFNFSAFFFSTFYFLYRKMYLIGIILLTIMTIILSFIKDYSIIFIITLFIGLVSGFMFNKLYVNYSKNKINKIKIKNQNEMIKKSCIKKGGTSIVIAIILLIIYSLILTLILSKINI